jgi:hypothetical protein
MADLEKYASARMRESTGLVCLFIGVDARGLVFERKRLEHLWEDLRRVVESLLRSACPRKVDHPTMWKAWGDATEAIGLDRDHYRIPHADPEG